jgi:N-hydroxyarylamine O-acetyltransferase
LFALHSYLARIGLHGRPTLQELHRAHVCAIPFENLDPHRGIPVSLDESDLERKLVTERRGGYCFEQNLLLKPALEALGYGVELILARVRLGAPDGAVTPRTHLLLRVTAGGSTWHADVGFGVSTPLDPLPFGPGEPVEQSGWRYRIVEDGPELVLQAAVKPTSPHSDWTDLYGFVPEPVPIVDVEISNWFTATHPNSPFVTGLIFAGQRPDGTRISLSDWGELALVEATPAGRTLTAVTRDMIPDLLERHFGLPGFALGPAGRIVLPGTG